MNNLIIIGNGGHAISCIEVIEAENKFKILGLVTEKHANKNRKIKYTHIGNDKDFAKLLKKSKNAFIAIGFIRDSINRANIFSKLKKIGFHLPVIISPTSYKSNQSTLNEGTILMHNSFVNSQVKIGKNCIINTGSVIEHEAIIGDNVHISTSAVVNGSVEIGSGSFIGSNSVIKEGIKIGNNCIVSAGSFLRRDLKSGTRFNK